MITRAHFIWFQGKPPIQYLSTIHLFRTTNPTFKIYLWDEPKLKTLTKSMPLFQQAIAQCQYMIQKIDIYKYIILYYFGGIYLDLDITVNRPFDQEFYSLVDKKEVVFSYMDVYSILPFRVVNNGIIIANQTRSSVFLDIISKIPWQNMNYKNKDWAILDTTGPFALSPIIQNDNRVFILEPVYVEGRALVPWFKETNGIYITHLHHSNWMERWLYIWIFILKYILAFLLLGLYIWLVKAQ